MSDPETTKTQTVIAAATVVEARRLGDIAANLVEQIKLRPAVMWGFGITTALILGLSATAVWMAHGAKSVASQQLAISQSNRVLLTQVNQILALVKDCTDPAGQCAQQGQKSQGDAIASLNTFTLIAVECAHQGSDKAIESCVLAKSREQGLVK